MVGGTIDVSIFIFANDGYIYIYAQIDLPKYFSILMHFEMKWDKTQMLERTTKLSLLA